MSVAMEDRDKTSSEQRTAGEGSASTNSSNNVWKCRNLQLYFSGQIVSMIGTWMQQMALSWLIYRLTNSAFMLGVVGFASQAPALLLTPFAGIVADRVNRHRLIIITQTLSLVQAGLLAALVFSGQPQLWQLIALSAFLGIIGAFDMPTRQTFLFDMLESKEQLSSAIGINSSITTLTRLIGPFVAGVAVARAGEGMCFLINALSYIAVIAALLFVKSKQVQDAANAKQDALVQLKEGFTYAFGFPPIRNLITLLALVGLFSMPFAVLMPAFAKDVFHGDASMLGLLTAASGAGSVVGAVFLGSRKGQGLGKWVAIGCALFGIGLIGFGFSKSLFLSVPLLATIGFGSMVVMAGSNTLIQTIVDADKRGRVMSIFIMAFMGTAPFGCMVAGALANVIGSGNTVVASGCITLLLAFIFASRLGTIQQQAGTVQVNEGITEADSELKIMNS